jgi:Zn-dependent peptidase ImmA (M78 family)
MKNSTIIIESLIKRLNNSLINESTSGVDTFFDKMSEKYDMSDELKEFIVKTLNDSDCQNIELVKIKNGAYGLALHDGVYLNLSMLNRPLDFFLFVLFHELAHQYQYKKYGHEVMYACYIGDISDTEGAEFMKKMEDVANRFAIAKINELKKLGIVSKSANFSHLANFANVSQIKSMIIGFKQMIKSKNIKSVESFTEFMYNFLVERI